MTALPDDCTLDTNGDVCWQWSSCYYRCVVHPDGTVTMHARDGANGEWRDDGTHRTLDWARAHAAAAWHPTLKQRYTTTIAKLTDPGGPA